MSTANTTRRGSPRVPAGFDVARVRADFPILQTTAHGKPLVYLDNAATTQKPRKVIDAITEFYCTVNSNVHRGVHLLSERATLQFERARETVRKFIHASHAHEIIFVRGATEAINLVATSFGGSQVGAGDEIVISAMEHHSNIVPWQMLCERTGAKLRVIPINDAGDLCLDAYEDMLHARTRLVAIVHVSNALGTVNPVEKMIEIAHGRGVPVLVDGAQALPHRRVDVTQLDSDFYVFSGHKIYGPTGIGVLHGKTKWLEAMPPYQGGGDMIRSVTFEKTLYNALPYKFEAGTPDVSGAIGLAVALDYVTDIGTERIAAHEQRLLEYAERRLAEVAGLRFIGTPAERAGAISFVLEGIHPHDIGTILDQEGIAIRTGHHCAQPVMDRYQVPATARASFALYNTTDEVDALAAGLSRVKEVFA